MNKKAISLQIIASIFLLIVILFSIFPSIPIGFCWEKKRFLSDQDFIDNAVEELINRPVQRITFTDDKSGQRYQPAYPVYYKNKEEFFADIPTAAQYTNAMVNICLSVLNIRLNILIAKAIYIAT